MTVKKRLDTMRVIAGQSPALHGSAKLTAIIHEFNRLLAAERSGRSDAWLLKVLHTTRALDTTLQEVIAYKNWDPHGDLHSLGPYLTALAQNSALTWNERHHFARVVADKRNKYMHQAGAMPHKLEADEILNEMHNCFILVLAKI